MSKIDSKEQRFVHGFPLVLFFCLVFIFGAWSSEPLAADGTSPRYFLDANGRVVYPTGTYLKGIGNLGPQSISAFSSYLDLLERQNQTLIGVSAWEIAAMTTGGSGPFVLPYERTGPGVALDGGQKFDLSRFNQAYFDSLRSVVLEARRRGIQVGVTLFKGRTDQTRMLSLSQSHPFHSANNINGIENDPNRNGSDEESYSLAVPAITALQEEYVRKIVDTLNDLENVLYEISEESFPETIAWQNYMADYLQSYQTSKASQHPGLVSEPVTKLQASVPTFRYTADASATESTADQTSITGKNKKKNASIQSPTSTVATPTITPSGGSYADFVAVSLQTSTSGATVYYTTDGSSPTQSSNKYSAPFTVSNTTLVKAKAFKSDSNASAEASAWFTKTEAPVNVGSSGLVAHWKFDEGSGATAADASGNGHTATLVNGPKWGEGKVGKGISFDGINDNLTVANSNSLSLSGSFTLAAWVNPSSTFTDFRSILVKNYKYYLYASVAGYCGNGSPLGGFEGTTNNAVCQPFQLATNTWTHLALTHNSPTLTLYKDGVAIASANASGSPSPTAGILQIGGSQFGEYFKGLIDEVRIYNKALSDQEVQAIYREESGLVARWKFDEGSGTTAADASGNGHTATLVNGPKWGEGKVGKGISFDGINDNLTVAHSNSLDLTGSFTLAAWVNPSSTFTDFRSILVKNYKYYLYASVAGYCGNGSPLGGFEGSTNHAVCHPFQLATNTWTHLALTHNGSTLTLYKNAVAVASSKAPAAPSPTSGTLQIGGSQFGEYFKGLIDEVRIYNKALSDQEIHAVYQEESGGTAQILATPLIPQNGFAPASFDFSLSNSGDVTVDVGFSVTNSVSISLTSGTAQPATFSITGLPSGATASFSDSACAPACSTILTIATVGSTPAGNFPVTVTARGGDVNKTTVFTLTALLAVASPAVSQNGSSPNNESFGLSPIVAPVLPPVKADTVYYVATNGSDSNTCTQAQNVITPKRTIAAGIACLRANPLGNRLEIRGGTYAERLSARDGITWPAGTSWNNAPTIAAFKGETVTVKPGPGTVGEVIGITSPSTQYLIFDGIIFDAINVDDFNPDPGFGPRNGNVVSIHSGAGNIKFVNSEIRNAGGMGIHGTVNGLLWVAFSKIYHNGDTLADHGIYAVGEFLIENSEFYSNSGYGLQLYPNASTGTIRGNFIHSNSSGITVVGTFDIYNNVIANQNTGIDMGRGSLNGRIYNNTFYNLKTRGIQVGYWYDGVESVSGATGTIVTKNIYQEMPTRLDLQPKSSISQSDEVCYKVATPTGCTINTRELVNQSTLWSPINFQ